MSSLIEQATQRLEQLRRSGDEWLLTLTDGRQLRGGIEGGQQ